MDKLKRAELIEVARGCIVGDCRKCSYKDAFPNCWDCLVSELAEELEKADKIITVGSGENYEVRNDG